MIILALRGTTQISTAYIVLVFFVSSQKANKYSLDNN